MVANRAAGTKVSALIALMVAMDLEMEIRGRIRGELRLELRVRRGTSGGIPTNIAATADSAIARAVNVLAPGFPDMLVRSVVGGLRTRLRRLESASG